MSGSGLSTAGQPAQGNARPASQVLRQGGARWRTLAAAADHLHEPLRPGGGGAGQFLQDSPAEILVIHDELDLPPGGIRLKQGGGNGGHNGLKDIQARLGTPDFWRLRSASAIRAP
jgi:hypothetical protein